MQGLMRSFSDKETFSGFWEEDLDSMITVYETMARMLEVVELEKLKGFPVMLSRDELIYFSQRPKIVTDLKTL